MTLKIGTLANRSNLGMRERVEIMEHLKDKIKKLPGGFCAYVSEDDCDRAIADAMAFPCSAGNVAGVRVKMFGKLRDGNGHVDLSQRIETLEKAVELLYDRLGEPSPLASSSAFP